MDNKFETIAANLDRLHVKILNHKFAEVVSENEIMSLALAVETINRQQAEIARLQKEVNLVSMRFQDIQELQEETRAEVERLNALLTTKNKLIEGLDLSIGYAYDRAIEEFAEKLKSKALTKWDYHDAVDVEDIDELVNEMIAEK